MRVLLLRPDPGNERFGLGPFFRVEPLGLEYVAAALQAAGHEPAIGDLRFRPGLPGLLRRHRPQVVGISCMHALEFDQVVELAREVRRRVPGAFVLVGGHAAAAYPPPLEVSEPGEGAALAPINAICVDDGEEVVPALVDALASGRPLAEVAGLLLRTPEGFVSTAPLAARTGLDRVPLPLRSAIDGYRNGYHCLLFKPVWLIETARGCPYRCNFCSVWKLYDRSFRERSIGAVADDFASTGPHVFVADDLFWNHPSRSLELAHELARRGVHKRWILVQSRCDLVAKNAELLAAWRPLADDFDIFFGLEAATDDGLEDVRKDTSVETTLRGVDVARRLGYEVTGNFLIDPDWDEASFHALWDFVATHRLERCGFTLLTPLPGTELYEQLKPRLVGQPWSRFDMHHLLWEPRLGAKRFFELYAETWRRSILNLDGDKRWSDWAKQIRLRQLPYLTRVLLRTQRMMRPEAYLAEYGNSAMPSRREDMVFPVRPAGLPSAAARDLPADTRPAAEA